MDVTLRLLTTLDDALELAPDLEGYVQESLQELRDEPVPEGCGERLLRRVLGTDEGLVLTAHLPSEGGRIGFCVTGPLVDPLAGDALPMVVALWVDPDWRHRGLARALVARAREELGARGRSVLAARAGHNDDALISMGERWGFVRAWEVMVHEE